MDFNFRKPSHIFALLLLIGSFTLLYVLPIVALILYPDMANLENIYIPEIVTLLVQLLFLIFVFVITPFAWYFIVDNLKAKDILRRIKLVSENIDKAFLWGLLSAVAIFALIFVIELGLLSMGQTSQDLSNIPDIQRLFSWPTMFFLVAVQPIGEEIFFRGFLFEKIEKYAGGLIAIVATAFLFGLAHISYGKIFPVVMPILMGVVLGYIVFRTKNLYSAIIAHVVFNVTSLTLAYVGQQLLEQIALTL